jgi:hypothetical protein
LGGLFSRGRAVWACGWAMALADGNFQIGNVGLFERQANETTQ